MTKGFDMNKVQKAINLMDKEDMLKALETAEHILETAYTNTAECKDASGKELLKKTAQNRRSQYKNKLCIVYLLEELCRAVPDGFCIADENSQLGFNRLTEV